MKQTEEVLAEKAPDRTKERYSKKKPLWTQTNLGETQRVRSFSWKWTAVLSLLSPLYGYLAAGISKHKWRNRNKPVLLMELMRNQNTHAGVGLLLSQSLPSGDVQHWEVEEGRIQVVQAPIRNTPFIVAHVYAHNSGPELTS